jgi:hypothetical protein
MPTWRVIAGHSSSPAKRGLDYADRIIAESHKLIIENRGSDSGMTLWERQVDEAAKEYAVAKAVTLAMKSLPTKLSPETIARAAIDYYHADVALNADGDR